MVATDGRRGRPFPASPAHLSASDSTRRSDPPRPYGGALATVVRWPRWWKSSAPVVPPTVSISATTSGATGYSASSSAATMPTAAAGSTPSRCTAPCTTAMGCPWHTTRAAAPGMRVSTAAEPRGCAIGAESQLGSSWRQSRTRRQARGARRRVALPGASGSLRSAWSGGASRWRAVAESGGHSGVDRRCSECCFDDRLLPRSDRPRRRRQEPRADPTHRWVPTRT